MRLERGMGTISKLLSGLKALKETETARQSSTPAIMTPISGMDGHRAWKSRRWGQSRQQGK